MTAGELQIANKALDIGKSLAPDALGAVKRLVAQHSRMTEAMEALRAMDTTAAADDPAFVAADDEYDVQRGLWYEAVELELKNFGTEVLTEVVKAIGAYIGV